VEPAAPATEESKPTTMMPEPVVEVQEQPGTTTEEQIEAPLKRKAEDATEAVSYLIDNVKFVRELTLQRSRDRRLPMLQKRHTQRKEDDQCICQCH
jgi:hypothetical protein